MSNVVHTVDIKGKSGTNYTVKTFLELNESLVSVIVTDSAESSANYMEFDHVSDAVTYINEHESDLEFKERFYSRFVGFL